MKDMPDDFRLKWPREGCPRDPDALPPDPNGPSIFTAVEEQPGLELRTAKGPVEMLVVEL